MEDGFRRNAEEKYTGILNSPRLVPQTEGGWMLVRSKHNSRTEATPAETSESRMRLVPVDAGDRLCVVSRGRSGLSH